MIGHGLAVTINTDDPGLMQTTLVDEYRFVVDEFGATPAQLREMCLTGLRASWLDLATKTSLLATWEAEIDTIFAQAGLVVVEMSNDSRPHPPYAAP
jgi:adenosine deaminase